MLKEHKKGSYNFKWIGCINDILVAVGRPDLFKTEPVNGAYNNRNGPERTGMDRNAPEWASITGMDIKISLFYAI